MNYSRQKNTKNSNIFKTPQSLNSAIKSICDIMRRSNCAGAMQYIPELTWLLFLRILDEQEATEAKEAEIVGNKFIPSLISPYRWHEWAAPNGWKRIELQISSVGIISFVNNELIPYLKSLKYQPNSTHRQKAIAEIMSEVEKVRIDTENNLLDVLDKIHQISNENVDFTHIFPLSQVYEGFLLKISKKTPLTLEKFDEFFRLLAKQGKSDLTDSGDMSPRSWTVSRKVIESNGYNLMAVNPNTVVKEDSHTKEELLHLIEAKGFEVMEALASVRNRS